MQLGVNDASVALTPNNGLRLGHHFDHVYLAHRRGKMLTTVLLSHIAQGNRARQIRHRVAGSARPGRLIFEYIIGHGD